MSDIKKVVAKREAVYGEFKEIANLSQRLKLVLQTQILWSNFPYYQREAIEMILHKIARATIGSKDYADNWVDIAGYAQLVIDRLEREAGHETES